MNQKQKKILNQFDPGLRNHIVEFCKKVSSIQCDVFVLMARKAACFITILEDSDLLTLNGRVVSERILDYNTDWFRGKNIVIIDDTVISGTSIHQIIQNLNSIGVASIRVQVFCVNKYWFVGDLLEKKAEQTYLEKPYVSLEHTASLKFCRDIVKVLAIYPRPYSTDFPIYERIKLRDYHLHKIQKLKNWKVIDTTTKLQLKHGIRCFSLNPNSVLLTEFYERLGISLQEYSFFKIRIYSQQFTEAEERTYFYCRALPLIIFNPISTNLLDDIINSICIAENTEATFVINQLSTGKAKLRFIQFYFAHRFFLFCFEKLEIYLEKSLSYVFNTRETELIFPPILVKILETFTYTNKLILAQKEVKEGFLQTHISESSSKKIINPLIAKDKLLSKFLELYYEKELVARRIVKSIVKEAFNDEIYTKTINRLNEGFTFGELKIAIQEDVNSSADQSLILSNFLDNGIDSGIIVPVTQENNGFVSRGYRHGEEIIWGENNDKLLGVFYERFLEVTKAKDIGNFLFQKLLVLFLKMGLKSELLEEYNFQTPPPQTLSLLGVRSYLFGKITIVYELKPFSQTKFNPILDYDIKGYWTSARLIDLGAIKENEKKRFELNFEALNKLNSISKETDVEPNDLAESLIASAEEIAELLATARKEKLLSEKGLVYLTSCLTIHDCISSIAAEGYIYNQSIEQVLNWSRSVYSRGATTVKYISNLRDFKKNPAWTAINSGREKFKDYKEEAGEKLVDEISTYFEKNDRFKKRAWDKYWAKDIDPTENDSPDLHKLNNEFGLTLIEINTLLIYLHQISFEFANRSNEIAEHIKTKRKELDIIQQKIDLIVAEGELLQVTNTDAKQIAIDFVNASVTQKLDEDKKTLKDQLNNIENNIDYWENYFQNDLVRVNSYYIDYKKVTNDVFPLSEQITNLNSGFLQSSSDTVLKSELIATIKLLDQYKTNLTNQLEDFSALVPQWGKINPIIRYDCILHINTKEELSKNREQLKSKVRKVLAEFQDDEWGDDQSSTRSVLLLRPKIQRNNTGYFIAGKGQYKIDRMTKLAGRLLKECSNLDFDFQLYFHPALEEKWIISAFYNDHTNFFDVVHDDFYDYFNVLESQYSAAKKSLIIFNNIEIYSSDHYKKVIKDYIRFGVRLSLNQYNTHLGKTKELIQFQITGEQVKKNLKIAVVTALPKEFAAMKSMLDSINPNFEKPKRDPNDYIQGTITNKRKENIDVILVMAKTMGNNMTSALATNLIRSFPDINDIILTGIAGGVPDIKNPENHVRLGDIVVTDRNGILQYDNIKESEDTIKIRDATSTPSATLLGLCNLLEVERFSLNTPWNDIIKEKISALKQAERPSTDKDILRLDGLLVDHPNDIERVPNLPRIHFGAIGSANTLLKNEKKRDFLRDHYKVKAIEMEGSGIADGTWQFSKGYLVVRGIVDYCNEDKNDEWQMHGALCAAAYTKSLIKLL